MKFRIKVVNDYDTKGDKFIPEYKEGFLSFWMPILNEGSYETDEGRARSHINIMRKKYEPEMKSVRYINIID